MHYLIVSEGGQEYGLCSGDRQELEALAKQLRAANKFRYVRVDSHAPPAPKNHSPPKPQGPVSAEDQSGSAPA